MDLYGEEKYWEARYAGVKDHFDWYQRWVSIKDTLAALLRKTDLILNAGCGISRLAEEMYDDGFERVISVDVSPVAVKFMSDKCRHKKDEFKCSSHSRRRSHGREAAGFRGRQIRRGHRQGDARLLLRRPR